MHTLTIQQASQRLKVTTHTLRFWEKELEGAIVPLRTQGGQRRYTSEHLFLIEEIKRLKRKGHSLVDIKEKLNNSYDTEENNSNPQRIDLLANQIAQLVRSAIYRFFQEENLY
jgi:DNA-binding transcriptional MerR regulator